jgi:hypothetical protein
VSIAGSSLSVDSGVINLPDGPKVDFNVGILRNVVIGTPRQTSDLTFFSFLYSRSQTTLAHLFGSVSVTFTGAGTAPSNLSPLTNGMTDLLWIDGTDNTTTKIQIDVDTGRMQGNYSWARWFPYVSFRVVGGTFTWYDSLVVYVSHNNTDWYTATGWDTTSLADEALDSSLWIGAESPPPVPGYQWRYARFVFTERHETSSFAYKANVWISQVGIAHISHEAFPQYARVDKPTIYRPTLIGLPSSATAGSGALYNNGDGIVRIA